MSEIKWAYGVTTVPARFRDYLPRTLKSLAAGGFPNPRLFIDGGENRHLLNILFEEIGTPLDITERFPPIRTYGNYMLGLAELYIRQPERDLYAMFQDDMVCSKGLREYLEKSCLVKHNGFYHPRPVANDIKVYWNLYTWGLNQKLSNGKVGWFRSNQRGLGAVALVYTREAVVSLLTHQHSVLRPQDVMWGHKKIDGGIITALSLKGHHREVCHNPSLVQHIGDRSSMSNQKHPPSPSFRGEDFDLCSLLPAQPAGPTAQ